MKKSTITCDMEGVIETMNEGAEEIFGYRKEELIGKKRVSIFSPGEIVLQNVANWLETAVKKGVYEGETVFINKNKEEINAKIKITPTFKNGRDNPQTGYCGVTQVIDKEVNVKISNSTKIIKWLAITRMPFTSASILPILVTAAYFAYIGDNLFSVPSLVLTVLGILFAHLSINVFNDYFDYVDGTDEENTKYFQQLSGGSRAVELGLISIKNTKKLAILLCIASLFFGSLVVYNSSSANIISIFIIAKIALFLGYYYTAPPLRFISRRGLGELSIFLTFGPLLTLGTAFAIFQGDLLNSGHNHLLNCILLGIPMGLLTTNILLINQFPDSESDARTGKNHLVVTFGKKNSRWIYLVILLLAVVASIYFAIEIGSYLSILSSLIILIYGLVVSYKIFKNYNKRCLVSSNWSTIYIHTVFCFSIILFLLIS